MEKTSEAGGTMHISGLLPRIEMPWNSTSETRKQTIIGIVGLTDSPFVVSKIKEIHSADFSVIRAYCDY